VAKCFNRSVLIDFCDNKLDKFFMQHVISA